MRTVCYKGQCNTQAREGMIMRAEGLGTAFSFCIGNAAMHTHIKRLHAQVLYYANINTTCTCTPSTGVRT